MSMDSPDSSAAIRPYSNRQINRAGQQLRNPSDPDGFRQGLETVRDWRTLHESPVAHFRSRLEQLAHEVDPLSLVATRLKRLPTIVDKLTREPHMRLASMQDVGGLRAVLNSVADVRALVTKLSEDELTSSAFELKRTRDYIRDPKPLGYRGIHLVYCYRGEGLLDINEGRLIEVQVRTRLQHAWATAVEVVGTFRREALKSGQGNPDWLELFRLAGDLGEAREDTQTPVISPQLEQLRDQLKVIERLKAYGAALKLFHWPEVRDSRYFVLVLDMVASPEIDGSISAWAFPAGGFDDAVQEYRQQEQMNAGSNLRDVVLVGAESQEAMREAYPNYFADTFDFVNLVYSNTSFVHGTELRRLPAADQGNGDRDSGGSDGS